MPKFLLKGKSGTVKTSGGKNVKWSSDNNNVLAIDNKGNITAKNVGSAKITGTSKSKQVSMVVKVISMEFSEKNIKIPKGNSKQIKVTIDAPLNFNPYDYSLSFSRSSTSFLKAKYSTKPDDQEYVSPKKNLPENDTIVRFTYNVDLFAQSKSGQTDISFFIADKSSSARISQTVQSLESSNNFNIICPQIEYSNDMKTMYITMYDKSSFFRLYYTSVNTGSYATWKPMNNTYKSTDGKSIKIDIPSNASQAKLEVFSNNGNDKRNCYTIPFSTTSYTYDYSIKCPKFTENSKPQGLAPVWKENGINQHSGYSNLKLSYSLEGVDNGNYSKYQYNWYIRNGVDNNNEWINTFKTVNYKSELSLFPIANYNENVQGNLLVIDEYGNIKSCYTDLYDDSIFDKIYKKDDVNYYFEKGIPENRRKQLINMINDIPKGISMSTKNVFYFNTDTWARHKWGGGAWTRGCYVGECNIRQNVDTWTNYDYYLFSTYHEMGHNLDSTYFNYYRNKISNFEDVKNLYSKYKNKVSFNTNKSYKTDPNNGNSLVRCPNKMYTLNDFNNNQSRYNEWYYKCTNFEYLRDYSYVNSSEFWADIVEYTFTSEYKINYSQVRNNEVKVNDELIKIRKKYINNLIKYQDDINKWRSKNKTYNVNS